MSLLAGHRAARRLALTLLLVNSLLPAGQVRAPLISGWPAGVGLLGVPLQADACSEPLLRNPPFQPDTVAALAQKEPLSNSCRSAFRKSSSGIGTLTEASGARRLSPPAGRAAGQRIEVPRVPVGRDLPPNCHQSNRPPPIDLG